VLHGENEYFADLDLDNTPERVGRMWKNELLDSYMPGRYEALVKTFKTFKLEKDAPREMVAQGGIQFYSTCAHHMVPFFGHAAVGYIPGDHIVGLSKLARTIKYYSRMLQVQERLTSQVADFLVKYLKPRACIVVLQAEHLCMSMRGVQRPGTLTTTSALRPDDIKDGTPEGMHIKDEFYRLLRYR